jgi:hypothetical protein
MGRHAEARNADDPQCLFVWKVLAAIGINDYVGSDLHLANVSKAPVDLLDEDEGASKR